MKTITILLFSVLINSCGGSKAASVTTDALNSESKVAQENVTIEYKAHTRGSYKEIILDGESLTVQDNISSKPVEKLCTKEDFDKMMVIISNLNLKNLSSLEAPSKAHQYDGAALGNFKITKDGQTYGVPTFDAGNPNKEIAPLIEMLLNIANKK